MEAAQFRYAAWDFGDFRLKKTAQVLYDRMTSMRDVCLRKLGMNRAGAVRFGRFLANPKVTTEELIKGICAPTRARIAGRHVLAIQDTSEFNYQAHADRVSGLGTVGNGSDVGLFVHPLLVVDADDRTCLGLAGLHLWMRNKKANANYRKQPIEDKESYRWLSTVEAAKPCLSEAGMVTVVADRESDIYEMWARIPDAKTHLLVRACRDRAIETEHGSLYEWLSTQPVKGIYPVYLPAVPGKRTAHTAWLDVRYGRIKIKRPKQCSNPNAPESIEVTALEVREQASSVVGQEEPVHWRLLTTHTIHTSDDAERITGWYCQRWHIEQTFRTVKTQGLDVESSQIETGAALMKLACLALDVAVHSMQLILARDGQNERPASDVFTEKDMGVLNHLQDTLEGKTVKQKNPHLPYSLAWAAWIIGRLGGWSGYAREHKPGPVTMHDGLVKFKLIAAGWHAARGS